MHNTRKLTDELTYIGASDRRLDIFEGVYELPRGMSYNSYFLDCGATVVFDTADKAVEKVFFENIDYCLGGRKLDYVVVHHMEPDHSATLKTMLDRYPDARVVCNAKIAQIIGQFFPGTDVTDRAVIVKDGDSVKLGTHEFKFVFAPMVHWPEVMMSFDTETGTLFSADAFGSYGAVDGSIFADGHDFETELKEEARRYYTNIVGKYGMQTTAALKKAGALDIKMICPLHSYVWRKDFDKIINAYAGWASYTHEKKGVLIVQGSIYGNTANACEILASELDLRGIESVICDASVVSPSHFISLAFKYSHIVVASPTYNMGIYSPVEHVVNELASHGLKNRGFAVIENGSWAPAAGKLITEKLSGMAGFKAIAEAPVTVKSAVGDETRKAIEQLADLFAADMAVSRS